MRNILFLCLILNSSFLFSQGLNFDFETDSLSGWQQLFPDHWSADTKESIRGTKSLHHNYDDSLSAYDAIAYLHETMYLDSATTVWEFSVKYDYTPSSGNNWAFWLAANKGVSELNPWSTASGYIVGVNYAGSDDLLKLWKQDEGDVQVSLATTYDWQDKVTAGDPVYLKIERTILGEWSVYLKLLEAAEWELQGSVEDTEIVKSDYIGVFYEYTSTQDRKLWIDDISVEGVFYTDVFPPKIEAVEALERNVVQITFSEEIDTAYHPGFLLNGLSVPEKTEWINLSNVQLTFASTFSVDNSVEVLTISDLKSNIAESITASFSYYLAQMYDVVITEVLADPTDAVGLPESEFLEVYNRSDYALNILDWKLTVNDNEVDLPEKIIYPNQYIILTGSSEDWSDYPDSIVVDISSMPALSNDYCLIELYTKYNSFIHGFEYSDDLYETETKQDGGWTIEMLDVEYPCIYSGNWKESVSITGGTPGAANSSVQALSDFSQAELQSVVVVADNELLVSFSKPMDSLSVSLADSYFVNGGSAVSSASALPPYFNEVSIVCEEDFETSTIYTLELSDDISDCSGIQIVEEDWSFGVPVTPESEDLVINEVLYEANDYVPEFIECYNRSENVLELRNVLVAMYDQETEEISKETLLSDAQMQLLSGEYIVFTEDKDLLLESFPSINSSKLIELDSWLSLSNDGATLVLLNYLGEILDLAVYSEEMHFSLLNETQAVSLERISPDKSGISEENWHSASSSVNYATPTLVNSQFLSEYDSEQEISINPTEISPDNDGVNDLITISYSFDKPGYLASISIFSSRGVRVVELVNNEVCSTTGSYIWDGLSDDGGRLSMGYYIVVFEASHTDGDQVFDKQTVLMLP